MARRSFRDRFFTPPVARAMTSPLGIVLAGAGAAVGLAVGSVPAAIALAIVAWGGRVAAAVPRDPRPDRIDPFTLGDPWKRMVQDAVQAQSRFAEAINEDPRRPLRERMEEIGQRIAVGVQEAWRVGRSGQAMMEARRRIDTAGAERRARRGRGSRGRDRAGLGAGANEVAPRADRLGPAARPHHRRRGTGSGSPTPGSTRPSPRAELSIQAGDVHDLQGLGDDVDSLVDDLEALRLGLEELDRPSTGTS